jgi:hypothetical protein
VPDDHGMLWVYRLGAADDRVFANGFESASAVTPA